MIYFCYILFLVSAIPKLSDGVQINMLGSLRIGKEVVETLSHFVNKNKQSGRRSLDGQEIDENVYSASDTISLIVNSAFLCRDLNFCQSDIGILVNQYIITLAKTIENIFNGLVGKRRNEDADNIQEPIFEYELKRLVQEIKHLLIVANEKITDENDSITWLALMKRINAKFQARALAFAYQKIEGNVEEISDIMKKITQIIVTETVVIELQFENKLCVEHEVCAKSHECTAAINTLLEQIKTVSDERAKEFIRYFYETLPSTNFYYKISESTGHEFQSILHDMGYADNLNTKNILAIIQKIVEFRLNSITAIKKDDGRGGKDVKLFHVILSDMDYFYSKEKRKEPFHDFLSDFFEWTKVGGRFGSPLRRVMKNIENLLGYQSDVLVRKLLDEVKTFMESTVDPVDT